MGSFDNNPLGSPTSASVPTTGQSTQDESSSPFNLENFVFESFESAGSLDTIDSFKEDSSKQPSLEPSPTLAFDSYVPSNFDLPPAHAPPTALHRSGYGAPQYLQSVTKPTPTFTSTPYRHLCWHESIGWYHMGVPGAPNTFSHHIVGFYERAPVPSKFQIVSSRDELNLSYVHEYPDPELAHQAPPCFPHIATDPTPAGPYTPFQKPQLSHQYLPELTNPSKLKRRFSSTIPAAPIPNAKRHHPSSPSTPNPQTCTCLPTRPVHPRIPRPRNAFILFRSDYNTYHADHTGQRNISREASEAWHSADEATKTRYQRLADQEREEHRVKYPGYKFRPKRRCECKGLDEGGEGDVFPALSGRQRRVPVAPIGLSEGWKRSPRLETRGALLVSR